MALPGDNNANVGTIRTTVNTTVLLLIIGLLNKVFDWNITLDDALPWTPVVVAVIAVFYRLSLVISQNVPWFGYVLFGVNRSPGYTTPPPAVPAVAEEPVVVEPGGDAGQVTLEGILVMAAVAIVVFALGYVLLVK